MTDLLPIVFTRGQNEGIDPRLAPNDVHRLAQNVRWRKDGRPAKRYGLASVPLTGLNSVDASYTTQAVNAVATWNDSPLFAVGSGVRVLRSNKWLPDPSTAVKNELPHWGPGERSTISWAEGFSLANGSVGFAGGVLLYLWDDGTSLFTVIKTLAGNVLSPAAYTGIAGIYPRCISCASYIHFLYKAGTSLKLATIDPTTLMLVSTVTVGTLAAATSFFDACSRGTDLVVAYQNSSSALTVKLFTSASTPALSATQTVAAGSDSKIGIAGDSTSEITVVWLVTGTGAVTLATYNNALSALTGGPTVLESDYNNTDQPSAVVDGPSSARIVWGGYDATTQTSYMRNIGTASAAPVAGGVILSDYGVRPASKPFYGPAKPTIGLQDGRYIWVHTHNSAVGNVGNKWDDQRTYYLVQFGRDSNVSQPPLRRQLHTPNVVASVGPNTSHLADVVNAGTGNGFHTALVNTLRYGNAQSEAYGLDAVSFFSIFETQRLAARDTVMAGRAVQFSGGALFEYTGSPEETGFTNAPVIQSITLGGGGSLTATSQYYYCAVYEWLDAQGRRHRSAPSDPFVFTSGGSSSSAALVVKPLVAASRLIATGNTITLHIYRTLAGQATFHRVTPNIGAPGGNAGGFPVINYTDLMSDANAAKGEFLYTDGGVVPNQLPPPCTFMTVCNARVWLGGQLDRCVVTASKILVDGEPTQFSAEDEFSVFLPQKCTGLAAIDGTVVAFARERIYFISGDGPNDQGIGSFAPPTELPTDVGCIDWRSIVECSLGVFFQSKRGIFLLPRGFGTPVFIGAEIEDTLSLYPIIVSATLVSTRGVYQNEPSEITIRFVCNDADPATASVTLVYDLRTGGWSVDTPAAGKVYGLSGSWDDTFVKTALSGVGALAAIAAESASTFGENGHFISTAIGTGDIRPFGVGGYGQFNTVLVMGEFREASVVRVQVSVDGVPPDSFDFNVSSSEGEDGVVYLDVTPREKKGSSLRVTVTDLPAAGAPNTPTEGFIAQALFIETELIGGAKRLPKGRRK